MMPPRDSPGAQNYAVNKEAASHARLCNDEFNKKSALRNVKNVNGKRQKSGAEIKNQKSPGADP